MTFKEACYARGLLDDDQEYVDAILKASLWSSGYSMRKLFVTLLMSNSISRPERVWDEVWPQLSDDAEHRQRILVDIPGLILSYDEKKNFALLELEKLLLLNNKSLKDFPSMPLPTQGIRERDVLFSQLTDEQRLVYDQVTQDISSNGGGLFFVYGYGGTGKTFVWKALSSHLRSQGEVVLNVASSGIASLLLPGGRTAHSRFSIPISLNKDSVCNIKQGSDLAELIVKVKLIIWDEALMMHKHCFEALDRTLRDLLRFVDERSAEKTFRGKTVVLGGDFRQILPVIPKGARQDIVSATINSSYLWSNCKVLRLTKNLRLRSMDNGVGLEQSQQFAKWLASIGDGIIGKQNDSYDEIDIPQEILLPSTNDPITTIVESTFPGFHDGRCDESFFEGRVILAPTLDVVNSINEYMNNWNTCQGKTYLSCDTVCKSDSNNGILGDVHTPKFLNRIRASGVPNHSITLKVGSPIMLLRNIDHSLGLCNRTRLLVNRLAEHVIQAKIMTSNNAGTNVLIAQMSMTPSDPRLPFRFQRRQFSVMLFYAMTINKSQEQIKKPVFIHGQLYVTASRVTNPKGLKILICGEDDQCSNSTNNVVYKEVFNNL